jgi:sulfite reductase (NADPH) hemoprotein beta-component
MSIGELFKEFILLLEWLTSCRNVVCSLIPTLSKLHAQVYEFAKGVSSHLIPRTTAYHEIWLDKKLVAGEALKDFEPFYGEFYLPRKVRSSMRKKQNFNRLMSIL